jgi:hypothetical protein
MSPAIKLMRFPYTFVVLSFGRRYTWGPYIPERLT